MYQALYRKYRPRRFGDVVGQEHITQTLCRQIIGDKLSHAYLFVGTRGTGKTTCAKILSRAINCENPVDGEPCNKCASCVGIESGAILDVLEIDAASNNGVDNVRDLREDAIYSPASVKKRVYIIDEVHMLSTAAFNALLKILEEPPEHLMFILATTELHKVPATILSRCQRFSFKRISNSVIKEQLLALAGKEGIALANDAAEKLAGLGDGSMRDAISLLDQCSVDTTVDMERVRQTVGIVGVKEILSLAEAIAEGDISTTLGRFETIYNDGRDMSSLLNEITAVIREVLIFKLSQDSPLLTGMFGKEELALLSTKMAPERLLQSLEIVRETLYTISRGGSARLTLEICLIRLCSAQLSSDTDDNITRGNNAAVARGNDAKEETERKTTIRTMSETEQILPDNMLSGIEIKNQTEVDEAVILLNSVEPNTDSDDTKQGEFWQKTLEQLRNDTAVYSLFSDANRVTAEECDGVIIIRTDDAFTINQINSKTYSEPLIEAAGKILGRRVTLRVESNTGENTNKDKLDKINELKKFEIVSFT